MAPSAEASAEARAAARKALEVDDTLAEAHAALGHAVLSNLELSSGIRALQRATGLMLLRVHPRMDAIRGDARYSALVQKLGLVGDSRSPHALPATA